MALDVDLLKDILKKLETIRHEAAKRSDAEQETSKAKPESIIKTTPPQNSDVGVIRAIDKLSIKISRAFAPPSENADIQKLDKREVTDVNIVSIDPNIRKLLDFKRAAIKKVDPETNLGAIGMLGTAISAGVIAIASGPGVAGDIAKIVTKVSTSIFKAAAKAITSTIFKSGDIAINAVMKASGKKVSQISTAISKAVSTVTSKFSDIANLIGGSIGKAVKVVSDKAAAVAKQFAGVGGAIAKYIPTPATISKMLESVGAAVKSVLKKGIVALKFIPGFGEIINLYFAYERYKEGDYLGTLIELAGAIPGFGIVADFYSLYRDITTTSEERVGQSTQAVDFLGKIATELRIMFDKIKTLPLIRGVVAFNSGVLEIMSGNVSSGVEKMSSGALTLGSDAFSPIAKAIQYVDSISNVNIGKTMSVPMNAVSNIPKMLADHIRGKVGIIDSFIKQFADDEDEVITKINASRLNISKIDLPEQVQNIVVKAESPKLVTKKDEIPEILTVMAKDDNKNMSMQNDILQNMLSAIKQLILTSNPVYQQNSRPSNSRQQIPNIIPDSIPLRFTTGATLQQLMQDG